MTQPGDFRPSVGGARAASTPSGSVTEGSDPASQRIRPTLPGILLALAAVLLTALAWAVLRGILDLSVGLLVVSGAGGWAIGASLRGASRSASTAGGLALLAWLASLALTWLVTRATLPGSSLDLVERLQQTSFLDYTLQQAGVLEVASLVLYAAAAFVSVGRPPGPRGGQG